MRSGGPAYAQGLSLFIAAALIVAVVAPASGAPAPAVRGGEVVSGPRPGSRPSWASRRPAFAAWDRIDQMHVPGRVEPGSQSLAPDGSTSSFEGTADIHVTGLAGSSIEAATLTDVHFMSTQTEGGAGVAEHTLELPDLDLKFGPEEMQSGHITIWP